MISFDPNIKNLGTTESFFLFVTILVVIFTVIEKTIKNLLEMCDHTDTMNQNLKNGQSTRQWNILATIILSILVSMILGEHQIESNCEQIISYDAKKSYIPILIFTSYIMYDLIAHRLTLLNYFHHAIGLIPVLLVFLTQYQPGAYLIVTTLLIEISTIPMGLMYVVPKTYQSMFKTIFGLTFFLARPVFLTYVIMVTYGCMLDDMIYYTCVGFLGSLYILNLYWFVGIYRKFRGIKDEVKKD
jgi:hypothetical protein